MSSSDSKPKSLMSRNKGDGQVITGGRSIKHHRVNPTLHHSTWPANPVEDPDIAPAAKRAKKHRLPRKAHHVASDDQANQEKMDRREPSTPDAA